MVAFDPAADIISCTKDCPATQTRCAVWHRSACDLLEGLFHDRRRFHRHWQDEDSGALGARLIPYPFTTLAELLAASTPEAIAAVIRASGNGVERIGLEAGINSAWIARELREAKLPVIVIDATHAAAALKTGFRNKTDKNDARHCRGCVSTSSAQCG
ncbi:MAG TPA: hypothetical protein VLI93_17470 [Acetobacteraceae bacterium]|nr:hypothetical protein [Acetobacteraceae bacterium]